MTRVALVTPRFPPDLGGLEEYVGWVARTLRDSGHEVSVICTAPGRRRRTETFEGIEVHRLATWFTVSNTPVNPLWWWQLPRLVRRTGAEVVNAHAPVPGVADVAAYTSPVPVVLTYHAGSLVKGGHPADPALRAYERHVLPRVFARAARLVAVSPTSLVHGTGRATLVPPGVDAELFSPGSERRTLDVVYVGRVERTSRWKGLPVLLEAFVSVRRSVPGARLVVVGDGDDAPTLRARARELGIDDAVEWVGRVPHDELPAVYRRAGVTVLPSTTEAESFGMTLVEAMSCGCAVVGSDVGGIPFVVRDGVDGLLVPPGDAEALARTVIGLLGDPDRAATMGAEGRQAALARWDWRHQAEQTLQVITGAAHDAARPAARDKTREKGRTMKSRVLDLMMTLAERLRGRLPRAVLPLVVGLRARRAWRNEAVRQDARAQMRFLLEESDPSADLEVAARAYVTRQAWRGELRWHPDLLTRMRVEGMEHLRAARERGRGVMLNFVHHESYEGALASVGRAGVPAAMVVYPYMVKPDAARWLKQHMRVACLGGGRPLSAAVGSEGISDLLRAGEVVAMASDVPGRTPLRFAGRDVLGSFGAARIAGSVGAPVVVMTTERDDRGTNYVRLHEALDPADHGDAADLLRAMVAIHERAILRTPEAYDLPLSRWGLPETAAEAVGTTA